MTAHKKRVVSGLAQLFLKRKAYEGPRGWSCLRLGDARAPIPQPRVQALGGLQPRGHSSLQPAGEQGCVFLSPVCGVPVPCRLPVPSVISGEAGFSPGILQSRHCLGKTHCEEKAVPTLGFPAQHPWNGAQCVFFPVCLDRNL